MDCLGEGKVFLKIFALGELEDQTQNIPAAAGLKVFLGDTR